MSHFSVLIILPAGTPPERIENEIGRRLERWNENRDVEPYRDYEEGGPEEYWWVSSVRRGAQELSEGAPSQVRYDDLFKKWSVGGSYRFDTEAEAKQHERDDREKDARWADQLGEHPTWDVVAQLYNECYGHGKELATEGDASDSETLHFDPESGRAYTMSTRNPESLWDYWRIGGRWGGYFIASKPGVGLLTAHRSWDSPQQPVDDKTRADGGPKRLLDFEAMRGEAETRANGEYDKWEAVCAETPIAQSWAHFCGLVDVGEINRDESRRRYNGQPRIEAAKRAGLGDWDCPVEKFMPGREEYVAEARRGAVPGYALVTLDEEWIAPGRMGWFGMSSDEAGSRSACRSAVNAYLDEKVADDDLLIALDCHI
jgi:hypothetical protein